MQGFAGLATQSQLAPIDTLTRQPPAPFVTQPPLVSTRRFPEAIFSSVEPNTQAGYRIQTRMNRGRHVVLLVLYHTCLDPTDEYLSQNPGMPDQSFPKMKSVGMEKTMMVMNV